MTTMTTAQCTRCGRDYYTEDANENGQCCICNRDARMIALLGENWRDVLSTLGRKPMSCSRDGTVRGG